VLQQLSRPQRLLIKDEFFFSARCGLGMWSSRKIPLVQCVREISQALGDRIII